MQLDKYQIAITKPGEGTTSTTSADALILLAMNGDETEFVVKGNILKIIPLVTKLIASFSGKGSL